METKMKTKCPKCESTRLQSKGLRKKAGETKRRHVCKDCGHSFSALVSEAPKEVDATFHWTDLQVEHLKKNKTYVVTSYLNHSELNEAFWESLNHYCKNKEAKLLVIPLKYQNPSAFHSDKEEQPWDARVLPYLIESDFKIGNHLSVLASLKIAATNNSPLTGLETIHQGNSLIVGHSQLAMKSAPRPVGSDPIIITTTGSVSKETFYSRSRVGYLASKSHTASAVVVEVDGDIFHVRHLVADDVGGFYDLSEYYVGDHHSEAEAVALIPGDEHAVVRCPLVADATYFRSNSIAKTLRPKFVVRHDLFDGQSINHHHDKDFMKKVQKASDGTDCLLSELEDTLEWLEVSSDALPEGSLNVVVASNHDSIIDRWLMDNKKSGSDARNAKIHAELMLMKMESPDRSCLDLWVTEQTPSCEVEFLSGDESLKVCGVELGFHGDRGFNGSRGSLKGLAKLGHPIVIGHSHSPGIQGDCYQVGTSTGLRLDYNSGPTSWMNTHAVLYANGKIQLINIIRGKWRR